MRIGLFTDTYLPDVNGVVSSIVTLQQELEKNGHAVYVITTHPGLLQVQREGNVLRLPGVELKSLYGYVLTSPIHFAVLKDIREMELDVIHAHTEFGVGIFARIAAKMLQIPIVSTYHTTYEDYTHYVNVFNLESVDKVAKKAVSSLSKLYGETSTELIAPSQKTKEMLQRYGIKKRIHVIPTGLDLQRFDAHRTDSETRKQRRQELMASPDELLIIFVGRIAKEKSIDFVIDGFTYLKEAHVPVHFAIIGGGPEQEALEDHVRELGLESMITFAGKKPADQIPSYYHCADAFVSASLTETQGMTYIEALASELPVFARPDEVLEDLVLEGETGFLFKKPQQFAEKVQRFLALSEAERAAMKTAAKRQVEVYDSRIFYQKVLAVYESAANEYREMYRLESIRPKDDCVELKVCSPNDEIRILVSLETYFNKGLRKDVLISSDELDELISEEEAVKAYQSCLKRIAAKDRTRKEIYDWLTQNTQLQIKQINEIVEKLEDRDLINDLRYTKNQVYNLKLMMQGKNKISRTLRKKGIPYEMIESVFAEEDEQSEFRKALKWAQKLQPTIKEKSVRMKKNMMKSKLIAQGFGVDVINEVMDNLSFVEDERAELESLRKTAAKAQKRYQSKYSGTKLRNYVFRYCSAQGFAVEDIYLILSEMEWDDE